MFTKALFSRQNRGFFNLRFRPENERTVRDTVDLQSFDTTTSCIQSPILASCADYYGALGMNIGFTSSFSGRGSDAYVVVGTKK